MPTHDFMQGVVGNLWFSKDGASIPFTGIKDVELTSTEAASNEGPEEAYAPWKNGCTGMEFSLTLTKQSVKACKRLTRKSKNYMMRRIRYLERAKERIRRAKLKGEDAIRLKYNILDEWKIKMEGAEHA